MWGALSDERTGLLFTIAVGARQRIHSWVQVPRDSWPYFSDSDSRLRQAGGSGPRIYIPQEQGGPVISTGTTVSVPFLQLLGTDHIETPRLQRECYRSVRICCSGNVFTDSFLSNRRFLQTRRLATGLYATVAIPCLRLSLPYGLFWDFPNQMLYPSFSSSMSAHENDDVALTLYDYIWEYFSNLCRDIGSTEWGVSLFPSANPGDGFII
jgi:hypothetical protein